MRIALAIERSGSYFFMVSEVIAYTTYSRVENSNLGWSFRMEEIYLNNQLYCANFR